MDGVVSNRILSFKGSENSKWGHRCYLCHSPDMKTVYNGAHIFKANLNVKYGDEKSKMWISVTTKSHHPGSRLTSGAQLKRETMEATKGPYVS